MPERSSRVDRPIRGGGELCVRRKNEKKKERKLLKHCTLDSRGLLSTNPRLEVAFSSVHSPPEVQLGFDFYGTWRQEAFGKLESPCTRPLLGSGGIGKKKDAKESERAGGCGRKWGAHCITKCINFLINYA